MIVYRCVSERELAYMLNITEYRNAPHGRNTFKYDKNIQYIHFFYYYDSAISFMDIQNMDRYYNKYTIIMAYDIDDKILQDSFGLGQYNLGCVRKELKDNILQYFETIYFPEFAIPTSLISKEMIVGIGSKKRITPINIHYDSMEATITKNQKDFLEYEKWLFENGTNLSRTKILENKNKLFPVGNLMKNCR